MKTTAIVMGLLASGLVYLVSTPLPPPVPILVLLIAWAALSFLLQRGATSAAQVIARGFLVGAAEWLLLLCVGCAYALFAPPDLLVNIAVKSTIAAFMSVLCFAGFALARFVHRSKSTSVQTGL